MNDEMLETLASALPITLKELCLVMTDCRNLTDAGIIAPPRNFLA